MVDCLSYLSLLYLKLACLDAGFRIMKIHEWGSQPNRRNIRAFIRGMPGDSRMLRAFFYFRDEYFQFSRFQRNRRPVRRLSEKSADSRLIYIESDILRRLIDA